MPEPQPTGPDGFAEPAWKRPVRGSYAACQPAGRGRFGGREFASTMANGLQSQIAIIPISIYLEQLAAEAHPGLPTGVGGLSAWLFQTLVWLVLKMLTSLFRNYGDSLIRDAMAWLWACVSEEIRTSVRDTVTAPWRWLRGILRGGRLPVNPDDPAAPVDPNEPEPDRRGPIRRWLFPRRRVRIN